MRPTPSQTIGPFFRHGFEWLTGDEGDTEVHGRVLDGAGEPVPDAVLELWSGTTFSRALTDGDGCYRCTTTGPVVDVSIFARGLLQRLVTRIHFDDVDDPTLRAVRDRDGFRFDVHLQGPGETTFFAW